MCTYVCYSAYMYKYKAVSVCVCVCVRNSVVCPNQHALLPKYQFAIGKHSYIALEGD